MNLFGLVNVHLGHTNFLEYSALVGFGAKCIHSSYDKCLSPSMIPTAGFCSCFFNLQICGEDMAVHEAV